MPATQAPRVPPRISTGIRGLDDVLGGGLPEGHIYLVQGQPGTGKTTMALQFLLEGAERGERLLYITLAQTEAELRGIADSHGLAIEAVKVADLSPGAVFPASVPRQTVLQTRDAELEQTMQAIQDVLEREKPDRLVVDSLVEIQLLSNTEVRFRREFLNLKDRLLQDRRTALLLDTWSPSTDTVRIEALVHGVIRLDWWLPNYGMAHRRLAVTKMRGHAFVEGFHDLTIETGGAVVHPRLVLYQPETVKGDREISSGIAELDDLCGGGFAGGTTCLVAGNAGTGKSTLATAYALAAARSGETVAMFLFEERPDLFLNRARNLNMDLEDPSLPGKVVVSAFDPAEVSPGQLFRRVQDEVDQGAGVVVIDSLTGFLKSLPSGSEVMLHFHPLLSYLGRSNVLTLLVLDLHGIGGRGLEAEVDLSFLADSIVLLRQFDAGSSIRRTISVIKKRYGPHSTEVRQLRITQEGLRVEPIPEGTDLRHLSPLTTHS